MNLRDKYGYCIIPINTILFTSEPKYLDGTNRFFGLKYWIANSWINESKKFIVFKVMKDIEVLFMIKEIKDNEVYLSCGHDIFLNFCSDINQQIDDISIKQNYHLRQKMINILSDQNLAGWLTTLEGRKELEVFLFGYQGLDDVIKPILSQNSEYELYDALKFIHIFPSSEFYKKSKSNFRRNYSEYCEWRKEYEQDLITNENYTEMEAKFESFDLRLKLKI
jgi:hypothetical protein